MIKAGLIGKSIKDVTNFISIIKIKIEKEEIDFLKIKDS